MALENDLGRDDIKKLVWRIAIPSMLAQFVSVLYSIVDRMYIGNIPDVGSVALAGAGVCGPVVTMVGSVAFWVGIGGSPLMSMKMGQGDMKTAKKILANSFCWRWRLSLSWPSFIPSASPCCGISAPATPPIPTPTPTSASI